MEREELQARSPVPIHSYRVLEKLITFAHRRPTLRVRTLDRNLRHMELQHNLNIAEEL